MRVMRYEFLGRWEIIHIFLQNSSNFTLILKTYHHYLYSNIYFLFSQNMSLISFNSSLKIEWHHLKLQAAEN